ncbi:MAG: 50S ribosomal protein L18 [Spartobacteria bacterium]|nr:50S ribosomal protein L18 [Spartobacteria bacterium]
MKVKNKKEYRVRRHLRLRNKVKGTADRPRLSVNVSNRHINIQCIDDVAARTLVAASSKGKGASGVVNAEVAAELGRKVAEMAKEQGIEQVVFDRGGFKFGQRMKAVADAIRAAGLHV